MRNTTAAVLAAALLSLPGVLCARDAPLTPAALIERAGTYSPEYTEFVRRADGSPLSIVRDLNGNSLLDVAILSIAGGSDTTPTVAALSDPDRLYRTEERDVLFVVEVYYQGDEAMHVVELGRRRLWQGFSIREFGKNGGPIALEVEFRSLEGSNRELLLFASAGRITRLSLHETRSEGWLIADVNSDGVDDVVLTRRVPEAGRGFETFLELYSVIGGEARRTSSLGVVRALSLFFEKTAGEIEAARWSDVRKRVESDSPPEAALAQAFRPAPDEESDGGPFDYPAFPVRQVTAVFPRIADNPFPVPYLGQETRILFRIECCDEPPRVFMATVRMSDNPFEGPVFAFLTERETGR